MEEKTFKIVNGDISDGYHTFDELYDHRCLLYIAWITSDGCPGAPYRIPDHYPGWDVLGVDTYGGQISYHVPAKYRHLYESHIPLAGDGYQFDGHTSQVVIERIAKLIADRP